MHHSIANEIHIRIMTSVDRPLDKTPERFNHFVVSISRFTSIAMFSLPYGISSLCCNLLDTKLIS